MVKWGNHAGARGSGRGSVAEAPTLPSETEMEMTTAAIDGTLSSCFFTKKRAQGRIHTVARVHAEPSLAPCGTEFATPDWP